MCTKDLTYAYIFWYEKIRIGYVLKSADVLNLVSRRYSENSSNTHTCRHPRTFAHYHTHPCTPAHTTPTHPHTPNYTHIHVCTFACTCAQPCTPAHTRAHLSTPEHTRTHPHTPAHTSAHPHTPVHTPHIPADALNLINHMKLHVNTVI